MPIDADGYVPYGADQQGGADMLQGLLSPADAQSLVPPPPDTAPVTAPGQTTPVTGSLATAPTQDVPKRQDGPAWMGGPSVITPSQIKAATINAGGPSSLLDPSVPILPASAPDVGSAAPAQVTAPPGTAEGDTAEYNRVKDSGSGVSQIQRPWLRALATIGDVAGSEVAPGVAQYFPGTTLHHERLLSQDQDRIAQDQDEAKSQANLQDLQSQTAQRTAEAQQANSRANYYNPNPLTLEQAQAIGQPRLAGTPMDSRDYARMQTTYARNQTNLQTRTGGQSRTLSLADATAIGMPSLSGATMSNDEYQRALQQQQRNTQSGANNAANNKTRVTTTGMRDATSAGNSRRSTSTSSANNQRNNQTSTGNNQRNNSTKSSIQDRKDQNFGTGGANGTGNGSGFPVTTPQTKQKVAVGDKVNVGGRSATVTGFNPKNGKVIVSY